MDTMILQVPMDTALKVKAQKVANEIGFSSLQDAVRLFLAKLASGKLTVSFMEIGAGGILSPFEPKPSKNKMH